MQGFGICHGVAGNGLSLLCSHRTFKHEGAKATAMQFALFARQPSCEGGEQLKQQLLQTPDRPCSLFEGFGGLAMLLLTLLEDEGEDLRRVTGAACPWHM